MTKNLAIDVAKNIPLNPIILHNNTDNITFKTGKLVIDRKSVTIPIASTHCQPSLVYDGSLHVLTKMSGTGYSFIEKNTGTNAGEYKITAKLSNDNYQWNDGTTSNKTFTCKIEKKKISIIVYKLKIILIQ